MIDGATRLLAIIGDPISQARTPALLNPRIQSAGVNTVLVPMHIPAAEFDAVLPGLMALGNLDGLVVTYPFKDRAMAYCQHLSNRARQIGGLNAMRRDANGQWNGDMFDGVGLLNAVKNETSVAGARVLLIGAGGAGSAIGVSFAEAGAAALTVVDIDGERANNLVNCVGTHYPGCAVSHGTGRAEGHDIIINATPIGMTAGDGMPADVGPLTAKMTVADIVPVDAPTALMRAGLAAGATVVSGKAMTEGQAVALLEFFGILTPPAAN